MQTAGWANTRNERGRQMFANAGRADTKRWSAFHSLVCLSLGNKLCGLFFFFFDQQSTPTCTDTLTFQSMVVKAVMVGCKKSFCQSAHMNIYITLPVEFFFIFNEAAFKWPFSNPLREVGVGVFTFTGVELEWSLLSVKRGPSKVKKLSRTFYHFFDDICPEIYAKMRWPCFYQHV